MGLREGTSARGGDKEEKQEQLRRHTIANHGFLQSGDTLLKLESLYPSEDRTDAEVELHASLDCFCLQLIEVDRISRSLIDLTTVDECMQCQLLHTSLAE